MNPIALMVVMGTFGCALCSESVGSSNSKTFKYAVVPIQKNVITQRWGYAGMINITLFQKYIYRFTVSMWEYLILPTYSSLQSVAYTQVAYRRLPIDSSLLLSLEIFWPIPSMPEARL